MVGGGPWNVPQDTGEALDLAPGHLTVTIGYGPSLFDDRFGLADRRPAALRDLPAFLGDDLDPARSGGDIVIQACADDPQVAVHAVRNLVRIGFGVVSVRWSQLGFGRTSSTSHGAGDAAQHVRLQGRHGQHHGRGRRGARRARVGGARRRAGRPGWMTGAPTSSPAASGCTSRSGTARRSASRSRSIGRGQEGRGAAGEGRRSSTSPTSPPRARTASRGSRRPRTCGWRTTATCDGIRILRRGYTFTDGTDDQGHLDAGLFFLAYMRDAAPAVRADAAGAGPGRRAERVHRAHRVGRVRLPARPRPGRRLGPAATRLSGCRWAAVSCRDDELPTVRHWVIVVSRDHARRGVDGGFIMANHGKQAPLARMARGDGILIYSPTTPLPNGEPLRAVTFVGEVTGDEPEPSDVIPGGFRARPPCRRGRAGASRRHP